MKTTAPLLNNYDVNKSAILKWTDVPPEILPAVKAISAQMQEQGILEGTQARVCIALDVSGSMEKLYITGKVQALLIKALAMARCLDDDGDIEIFPFGGSCAPKPITADFDNFSTVINNQVLANGYMGGTNYTAVVKSVRNFYFKTNDTDLQKQNAETAVFVIFVTDGDPNEQVDEIKEQFKASSYQPIFWKIIALGSAGFKLLQSIDDADVGPGNNLLDNSDYKQLNDPSALTAAMLVEEFPQYLDEAYNKHQMLTRAPVLDEKIIREKAGRIIEQEEEKKGSCCVIQ